MGDHNNISVGRSLSSALQQEAQKWECSVRVVQNSTEAGPTRKCDDRCWSVTMSFLGGGNISSGRASEEHDELCTFICVRPIFDQAKNVHTMSRHLPKAAGVSARESSLCCS